MRSTGCSTVGSRLVLSLACVGMAAITMAAGGAPPPTDACALLPVALLNSTLNKHFAAPVRHVAPPAYAGQNPGTDCDYNTASGHASEVDFKVYVDHSPSEATATFQRLSMFYQPGTKVSGIGDSAYLDKFGAIHVLKGKVRYYIDMDGAHTAAGKKAIQALAAHVAAQL